MTKYRINTQMKRPRIGTTLPTSNLSKISNRHTLQGERNNNFIEENPSRQPNRIYLQINNTYSEVSIESEVFSPIRFEPYTIAEKFAFFILLLFGCCRQTHSYQPLEKQVPDLIENNESRREKIASISTQTAELSRLFAFQLTSNKNFTRFRRKKVNKMKGKKSFSSAKIKTNVNYTSNN